MTHLSLVLVPIPELQHAPLLSKCCKLGNIPPILAFVVFTFEFTFESFKVCGGALTFTLADSGSDSVMINIFSSHMHTCDENK